MAQPRKRLPIIGSTDRIDLPEFDLVDVPCKIDTGARTSSIHCEKVKIVERNGIEYATFKVLDKRYKARERKTFRFADFEEKQIRSSFGNLEFRYAIRTKIVVFGKTYKIWFTLSNRGEMRYPILLGKRFIKNKYLVDVRYDDLSYQQKLSENKGQ